MKKLILLKPMLICVAFLVLQLGTIHIVKASTACSPLTLTLAAGSSGKVVASWSTGSGSYKLYWSYLPGMMTLNTISTTSTSCTFSVSGSVTVFAYVVDQGSTCSPKPVSAYAYYNATGGSCNTASPTSLSASVTTTTANLSWTGSATKYQVYYKKVSSGTWASYGTTSASYSMSNLSASTCYVFYVTNKCTSGNGYSSHLDTFCTLAPCTAPANLSIITACKGFSAKWDTVKGATSYQVFITKPSTGWNANYKTTTNSYSNYMFTKGAGLQVYVEATGCNGGAAYSAASSVKSITIPSTGCKNDDEDNINSFTSLSSGNASIYPNPNNGQFTINISSSNTTDNAHIYILNMLGQVMSEQIAGNSSGHILVNVKNNNLPVGLYLVKVQVGNDTRVERMVIDK